MEQRSNDLSGAVSPRSCLACGTGLGANRAKEHVIADWLLNELGMSEEELTQIAANSATGEMNEARPVYPMNAFKEGRICAGCNSGWMSELESLPKTVLPDLLRARRPVTSLNAP